MPAARKSRVLVVDDSAVSRRVVSRSIRDEADIEVVAEAVDAFSANALIAETRPDVITLDLQMPQMDGLAFLRHLMRHDPRPVIVVSSYTPAGSQASIDALRMGAVDVIPKPANAQAISMFALRLKKRIRDIARAPLRLQAITAPPPARATPLALRLDRPAEGVIAIGASTGGPPAIETLLQHLPSDLPPILIVQHMPTEFTRLFARRLDEVCPLQVLEAQHRQELSRGCAYVAPGDHHLAVEQHGAQIIAVLGKGKPVHHQRPSVDVLFGSLARLAHVPVLAVLLTGMGEDGADGMVALSDAGHETIAQDEKSCVVFGMPREAIARGGAKHVVSLDNLAGTMIDCVHRLHARRRAG